MKLTWISWYRGFAMLLIVVYHLNQIRPIQNLALWNWKLYQFVSLLPVVVSVFFLLSGLLRSLSYWKVIFEWGENPPFWKWLKDRFFRIAPLFYLALILSFLWSIVLWDPDWKSFFVGFTFFSWVHPSTFFPVPINGPLWFVAYDMMGNIFVMIFMMKVIWFIRYLKIRKQVIIPLSFLFALVILLFLHKVFISLPFPTLEGIVSVWFPYYNPFIFGVYYLFWALIGWVVYYLKKIDIKSGLLFDLTFLFSIIAVWYFLLGIRWAQDLAYSYPISPFRFPLIPFLFWVSIFSLIFSKYLSVWIDNKLFLFIAEISYPLYLFHALVVEVLKKFFFSGQLDLADWFFLSVGVVFFSVLLSRALLIWERKLLKLFS